jgi:hypothetical protein
VKKKYVDDDVPTTAEITINQIKILPSRDFEMDEEFANALESVWKVHKSLLDKQKKEFQKARAEVDSIYV